MANIYKPEWKWRDSRLYITEIVPDLWVTCVETRGEPIRIRACDPHITVEGAIRFTDFLLRQLQKEDNDGIR